MGDGQAIEQARLTSWRSLIEQSGSLDERSKLQAVNDFINRSVSYGTDRQIWGVDDYWATPLETLSRGRGDCEDFALLKRKMLVDRGVDPADLLMTVVLQPNGEGHAVLTVRTDRGDFVLDNMRSKVMLWSETEYTYLKRQSIDDPGAWVKLQDGRANAVASVRK